jgi:hypothetical protein
MKTGFKPINIISTLINWKLYLKGERRSCGRGTGSSNRATGWVTVNTIVKAKQRIREAERDFVN